MITTIHYSKIKLNPDNPRTITDDKFKKLVKSIKEFPEMLEKRPIVVNKDMMILGGNMRYKACIEAGIEEIPVIVADDWDEEKQREFVIKDNVSGGEWDWDTLANEWDTNQLDDWGLDISNKFEENMKMPDNLVGEEENKKPIIKITFLNVSDLQNAEIQLSEIIKSYKGAFYSVSAGEL